MFIEKVYPASLSPVGATCVHVSGRKTIANTYTQLYIHIRFAVKGIFLIRMPRVHPKG